MTRPEANREAGSASDMPVASSYDASTPCASTSSAANRSRQTTPSGVTTGSAARASTSRQPLPAVAAPARRTFFDPWNSSSTGHQRAENRLSGSTSWRLSRTAKLSEQFKGGRHGGKRVADTVGAGSSSNSNDDDDDDFVSNSLRAGGQKSLAEAWGTGSTGKRPPSQEKDIGATAEPAQSVSDHGQTYAQELHAHSNPTAACEDAPAPLLEKQLFAGLCFYLNGSTTPLVSDHKLKQVLATHGASHSITLGRRTVTHVILGTVNSRGGAGGGLAATKIQKEFARTGGKAVKFITADWVLDSISANRRLPESRYSPLKLAPKSQDSVLSMMRAATPKQEQG